MSLEEDLGIMEKDDREGVLTNVQVSHPFERKLSGWKVTFDALTKLKEMTEDDKTLEHNQWITNSTWEEDDFPLNSQNFRCSEFVTGHEGKHVLFSGCSVTYGVGLYTKETWSNVLYNKMQQRENLAGYYNLGTPGTSTFDIVSNVFKYMSLYGNPDAIFLDLPDMNRFYSIKDQDILNRVNVNASGYVKHILSKLIFHSMWRGTPNKDVEILKVYAYNSLMMLEEYCKSNNIKLYIFSYVEDTINFLLDTDLTRVFNINQNEVLMSLYEKNKKNPSEFFLTARDGRHHGYGFHQVWADKMFEFYELEKDNDR
jgi:hypothetical protein